MIHVFLKAFAFCKTELKIVELMFNTRLGQITENLCNLVNKALIKP